jgi:hypothetical protein
MDDAVTESLIVDLLECVAKGERSYEEVMDAWRTSCPRLPVWELKVEFCSQRRTIMESGRIVPREGIAAHLRDKHGAITFANVSASIVLRLSVRQLVRLGNWRIVGAQTGSHCRRKTGKSLNSTCWLGLPVPCLSSCLPAEHPL